MVPILRLFMDRVHRRLIASMFRCNDAMQAYIRKSGTPYDNTTVNQYICTTLHLCRIGLMNHRRCNALNSYSDKSVMMRLAVSAVPYFYRYSNPTANKRGKNVGCIVSNRGGSLWRRDGSVWRFRPRKSRPKASTFAPERQGASCGFRVRSGSVLPQSVFGRIFMFVRT